MTGRLPFDGLAAERGGNPRDQVDAPRGACAGIYTRMDGVLR
jgi:hypothetical protein